MESQPSSVCRGLNELSSLFCWGNVNWCKEIFMLEENRIVYNFFFIIYLKWETANAFLKYRGIFRCWWRPFGFGLCLWVLMFLWTDLTNFAILIPMASDKVVGGPCPRVHVLERMSLVYVMKAYMDNTHGGTMTRIKYFFSMKPLKKPVYYLI